MKLIAGLGNPGRSYAETRHNVGWWVLDHLADVWHSEGWRKNFNAAVASAHVGAQDVRLLKPLTYMNLSGEALLPYLRDARIAPATDLLIVVDEVALPVGRFRLRARGSSGGHNGLKSIEAALGSQDYARLRVGVGPPAGRERTTHLADYVLTRAGKEDKRVIVELFPELTALVETWLAEGVDLAMTRFNRRPKPQDADPAAGEEGPDQA